MQSSIIDPSARLRMTNKKVNKLLTPTEMTNNSIAQLFNFLRLIATLKTTRRFKTVENIDGDSVADHTWRLAMFAFLAANELKLDIDVLRAVKMALVHDLAEIITDDIDVRQQFLNKGLREQKIEEEYKAIKEVIKVLSDQQAEEIHKIWLEYREAKTAEARFVIALDKMEGLFTLIEAGPKALYLPPFIGTFGNEQIENFPDLKPIFKQLKAEMKKEYEQAGIPWDSEIYEI